jgi:hypothetical protein
MKVQLVTVATQLMVGSWHKLFLPKQAAGAMLNHSQKKEKCVQLIIETRQNLLLGHPQKNPYCLATAAHERTEL